MKWTRRILISLLIFATLITALWWEENWRGQKIWEESCARLRAAGEPVEIADIIPPMIPDEENVAAAPIFALAFAQSPDASLTQDPFREGRQRSDGSYFSPPKSRPINPGDQSLAQEWLDYVRNIRPGYPPVPEGLSPAEAILFLLSDYDDEWRAMIEAVKRPHCRWDADYTEPSRARTPWIQWMNCFRERVEPRLLAYAASGDWEAYTEGVVAMLRLNQHLMNSAMGSSAQAIALAHQMLLLKPMQDVAGVAALDEGHLRLLQDQLSRLSIEDGRTGVRFARVSTTHDLLQIRRNELVPLLSLGSTRDDWMLHVQATMICSRPRGWKLAEAASFQDLWMTHFQHSFPGWESKIDLAHMSKTRALAVKLDDHPRWLSLDKLIASTWEVQLMFSRKQVERQALATSIMTWCAIQRYRLKHRMLPATLVDLQPAYLTNLPVDPIDGNPLRYAPKTNGNFIVYSIAWNGADDGGQRGEKRSELDWVWASDPSLFGVDSSSETQAEPSAIECR